MIDAAVNAPMFKVRYGKFQNPLPEDNTFSDFSTFVSKEERPGKRFEFPIKVSHEHGVTYDVTDTAFALSQAIDAVLKTAVVDGATIMVVANIAYTIMARGKNGKGSGNKGGAFFDPFDFKVECTMTSGELRRELAVVYGPGTATAAVSNIGATAAAAISGADLTAGQVVRLTTASWSAGIYINLLNAKVDIYQSDSTTIRESDVKVTAVNPTNCRITLQKDGSTASVGSGDVILLAGSKGRSCIGVQGILENATTIFEIDAATYPMWRSLSFPVGGALSRVKIGQMAARIHPTGLRTGGKLFTGAPAFQDLTEETSLLQQYVENTAKLKKQGASNLVYTTSIGDINVAMYAYMKQGIAMFIAKDVLKRVGTTDLTFSMEGTNDWFYSELPNNAGCQIRLFANMAPILEIPWFCAILTGIASNADIASA
jgi:hypothetical protein